MWPEVEAAIRSHQPGGKLPRPNGEGWLGPLRSPLREDTNPSFSVKPDSEHDPGGWTDHATGERGSLADLARRLGVDPREAGSRAEQGRPNVARPAGGGLATFCEVRRLDPGRLVSTWGVRETVSACRPALAYPTAAGVDRLKFLDGAKPKYRWARAGGSAHWYGMQEAHRLATQAGNGQGVTLYLVNGEPSVWAATAAGVPAVCCCAGEGTRPNAAMVAELVKAGFGSVRVVYDLDGDGRAGARGMVEALRAGGLEAMAVELPSELGPGGDVDDLHRRVGGELAAALGALPELSGREPEDAQAPDVAAALAAVPAKTLATDGGNAERFAREHAADLRYCHAWHKWLVWDERRWSEDATGEVDRRAKATSRAMLADAATIADDDKRKAAVKWAMVTDSRGKREAMIALATSEPGIPIVPGDLDRDPWLLNVGNGVVDLRTGRLRSHDRADLLTKLAAVEYAPTATRPQWERFIADVLPDLEVRRFVQKAVGYSLTGSVREQVMFFLYGTGANGKSVFLSTVLALLGDYGMQAVPDILVAHGADRHPTELADLCGRRLVATVEVEEGRRLAESLVKLLTGGDRIRARRMYEDAWSFEPTHKLWLAANHRPAVRGQDYAIWRRIRLVPFTVTIPEDRRDPDLTDKLASELPGILAWAVEGCLAWQREGLRAPEGVKVATESYRTEQDTVGRFIEEACLVAPGIRVRSGDLYRRFKGWCEEAGERPCTQTAFGLRLGDRGLVSKHTNRGAIWFGIGLVPLDQVTGSDGFDPVFGNFSRERARIEKFPETAPNPSPTRHLSDEDEDQAAFTPPVEPF